MASTTPAQSDNGITPGASPDHPIATAGPTENVNPLIVTSSPARHEGIQNSNALDAALNSFGLGSSSNATGDSATTKTNDTPNINSFSDAYTQQLDKMSTNSDRATQALISTIQAQRSQQGNDLNKSYDSYKRGLQLLGIQHNEEQFSPELLAGQQQQAENDRLTKLQGLDQQEAKALTDASTARDNSDFQTLKEKMDYIKQVKQDKVNALKDSLDTVNAQSTIAEKEAANVYDTLQKLSPENQESFLQTVAKQYNIPLGDLTQAVANQKVKLAKSGSTSSTKQTTADKKQLVSNITKIFTNDEKGSDGYSILGDDGYIDPNIYMQAYQKWIDSGNDSKGFATQFPAAKYINPSSYDNLPATLKPTKKSDGTFG